MCVQGRGCHTVIKTRFKILRGRSKEKTQRRQYLLAMGLNGYILKTWIQTNLCHNCKDIVLFPVDTDRAAPCCCSWRVKKAYHN